MEVADAFKLISRAIDTGRAANGYLVCGDLRGQCDGLVRLVLEKLFPNEPEQIANRCHPDVVWLEPQGRSRTIKVARGKDDAGPGMRDGLIEPMSVTAFSGGWKVGVVAGADRMQPEAANAFLKTLEEPPPRTLFLLLTDAPDAIMPTIVSRSQRIDLPLTAGLLTGRARDAVAEVMGASLGDGVYERAAAAARLAETLAAVKEEAGPEDAALARKTFFKTIMGHVRSWMVEERLPRYQAFKNIEAVEAAYRQSERSMSDDSVLAYMMDRLVMP